MTDTTMQISQFSKTASRCLVLCAAVLITTACTDCIEPFANPDLNGNISTLPADLQNVIRKRFPNTADRAGANVKVHQGRDEESSTIRISTVDGKNI